MKFLILNGPNLNLLGIREPDVYGRETYQDLEKLVADTCRQENIAFRCFQSNHEGDLVDQIQQALGDCDGIVINPAAYTHTSVALIDAIKAVNLPCVEVHISDVSSREDFRQISYVRSSCIATISGRGLQGYIDAMQLLVDHCRTLPDSPNQAQDL